MKRGWYGLCWILELLIIVAIAFSLLVPIQDYALREFKDWQRNPSPQTLKTFQDKRQDEFRLRMTIAVSLAVLAVVLAFPLFRYRPKPKSSDSPRL
jgi:hypothetical protein